MKMLFLAVVALIALFLGLAAVISGLTLLISPHGADDQLIGTALLAGGLTYFWKRTGYRGLK
jgi:hypothetical protein